MLRINEPFHGAVFNSRLGKPVADGLEIAVSGQCPPHSLVTVNGLPATITGETFTAALTLRDRETDITAVSEGPFGRQKHHVRVVWDKHSFPRYRFSIDDNSFFLRDIALKGYDSLFDCFYLDILRTLNREYGAKFSVNIYHEALPEFGQPQFFITDFPDRYRAEWESCADWLGLAFHARVNSPDRPYQEAEPRKLLSDMAIVEEQIVRFAGEQTLIPPTVIHWGMVRPDALRPLRDYGIRSLSGYFSTGPNGYDVNYRLDPVKSEYLSNHDYMMDFDTGIAFSRVDIICNNTPLEDVVATLEPLAQDPNHAEFMDLFTHEQYFWEFYSSYIPDHAQRLDAAIRWVTEKGYRPVFMHEGFLGAPE